MRSEIAHGGTFPDYEVPDLWHGLRTVTREIRPDWDLSKPGLHKASDGADYAPFHRRHRRSPQSMPSSYHH